MNFNMLPETDDTFSTELLESLIQAADNIYGHIFDHHKRLYGYPYALCCLGEVCLSDTDYTQAAYSRDNCCLNLLNQGQKTNTARGSLYYFPEQQTLLSVSFSKRFIENKRDFEPDEFSDLDFEIPTIIATDLQKQQDAILKLRDNQISILQRPSNPDELSGKMINVFNTSQVYRFDFL